jgi:microcin C transport system permease protein
MKIDGQWHFPVFHGYYSARDLGLKGEAEPKYRLLASQLAAENRGWILMPLVPFAADEVCEVIPTVKQNAAGKWCDPRGVIAEGRIFLLNPDGTRQRTWSIVNGRLNGDAKIIEQGSTLARAKFQDDKLMTVSPAKTAASWTPEGRLYTMIPSPCPPNLDGHWLGTDESGHDVLARLYGGFRILLVAAILYLPIVYSIGLILGAAMGYFGGWFDIVCQRVMEIWANIPFLYAIIFLSSLLEPTLSLLVVILVAFSWMGLAQQLRASAYQVAARDYVLASKTLGASHWRIILKHILPNCTTVILTTLPFSLHGLIFSLSALDYLGFGLPPTQPSWGDLLHQAKENWDAWWILVPSLTCLVGLMLIMNSIGDALQDAFDLKRVQK